MVRPPLLHRARHEFEQTFGRGVSPSLAVAPGRVNLIGEHTDYNDGFVLPMAIDRHVAVAFAPRQDRVLRAHAAEYRQTRELSLDTLERRTATEPDKRSARGGWFGYVAGVAWAMLGAGYALRGADLAIASEVPPGAGLSSSAAVEIAVARALTAISDRGLGSATRGTAGAAGRTRVCGRRLRHHGSVVRRVGARRLRAPD